MQNPQGLETKKMSESLTLKPLSECPLCGGRERHFRYPVEGSSVYGCVRCGLSYLDPCLDPAAMARAYESSESLKTFHDFHEGYYEYGSLNEESQTVNEFRRGLEILEQESPSRERRLFEVGFGNGLFLALAKRRGWQVDGVDTSPENIRIAKARFGLELKQGFFEEMPRRAFPFSAVAIMDVIEHVENPHRMLQKANECLQPGGVILLATPNEGSFSASFLLWYTS